MVVSADSRKDVAAAYELLDRINELAALNIENGSELQRDFKDASEVLATSIGVATHAESKGLYQRIHAQHQKLPFEIEKCFGLANAVHSRFRLNDYSERLEKVAAHNRKLTAHAFPNESRLARAKVSMEIVQSTPYQAVLQVAAAMVPANIVAHAHHQALHTYLGRQTRLRTWATGLKEVGLSAVGEAIPGLGVAAALLGQLEPQIEIDVRAAATEAERFDRLMSFNDRLKELALCTRLARDTYNLALGNLDAMTDSFQVAVDEILALPTGPAPVV